MRVAYISAPSFLDCDVPLVASLQRNVDITYVIRVSPFTRNQSMLRIGNFSNKSDIYWAKEVPGFDNVVKYIDSSRVCMLWQQSNSRWSILWSELKLLKFLISEKFDVVHLTWPLNWFSFPLYILRKKMVLTVHDPLPHSSNIKANSQFYRQVALKNINNFVILNKNQKNEFISTYNLNNKNILDSRLGAYYHYAEVEIKEPKDRGYVLFFGGISSYKGLDLLCKAMRRIKANMPSSHLIVAGRGDIYFDIEQYVNDKTIEFRNYYISDEELAGLIKNAAFVICPYIDATQSVVVMSSFSMCTPVVVTNVGGLPEMVGNGTYGEVIPSNNVEAIEHVILDLLRHPEKLQTYRDNIKRDYFKGEYSWSNIGHEMALFYKDVNKNK